MRKHLILASLLLSSALATPALADEGKGSLGLSSYALSISDGIVTDSFNGLALTGEYDITNRIAIVGRYYALTNTDFSFIKMDGFDLNLRFGPNMPGFTYFGEVGYYSETMSATTSPLTFDFSGGLFGAGIGYNFDKVNLSFDITSRSTGDYQGNTSASLIAITSALSLSYIF